jgi:hypothetical protein
MPVTSSGFSGVGQAPVGLTKGSWVIGFYMGDKKHPMILGSMVMADTISDQAAGVSGVKRKQFVPELGEKESDYATIYPNNKTINTTSGHVIEVDDTPKNERIAVHHKSGAYVEIFPDGSIHTKSMKDSVSITVNDQVISTVKGDIQIVANEGIIQIATDKDINLFANTGNVTVVTKTGTVDIVAPLIGLNA